MWVIVDQLTKSAHFLAVQKTFTLEKFYRLYIREIIWLHGVLVYIVSQVYDSFFREFPESHGDTIDDEHRFSSPVGRLVRENHPDVRGHATGMSP